MLSTNTKNNKRSKTDKVENQITQGDTFCIALHVVKMCSNFHLSYDMSFHLYKKRYDYVTKTTRKYKNKLFKIGMQSMFACLSVGIDIVPPFCSSVQHSALPQIIDGCFALVQYQYQQVDSYITNNVPMFFPHHNIRQVMSIILNNGKIHDIGKIVLCDIFQIWMYYVKKRKKRVLRWDSKPRLGLMSVGSFAWL